MRGGSMGKRSKVTVGQLLVGDSLAGLAESMAEAGFEAEKLVLVGMSKDGYVRVAHTCGSIAEVVGVLSMAQTESLGGIE
jgi:hypothetical protein